jgi:hypothetical protein
MNTCAFPKDLVLSVERLLLMTMGMPAGLRRQTDGASVKQQNDSVGEDTSNHVLIVLVKSVFFSFLVREFWFFQFLVVLGMVPRRLPSSCLCFLFANAILTQLAILNLTLPYSKQQQTLSFQNNSSTI